MAHHSARRRPPFGQPSLAAEEADANRFAPYLVLCAYAVYLITGFTGAAFADGSFGQAVSWQIGTAAAITGSVLAGVWLSRRGEDLAGAGFTMLGIAHGVFFAAIVLAKIDPRVGAGGVLLMVPAVALIASSKAFPLWVKVAGLAMCALFGVSFFRIVTGTARVDMLLVASYFIAEVLGVIWALYLIKDARQRHRG